MKKLFITALFAFTIGTLTFAQGDVKKQMTKEEKAAAKAKKEKDLNDALTQTGLTNDQQSQVKDVLTDAEQKNKDLKNDAKLTDEEKAAKKEEINAAKNDKLKAIMGADKFKVWSQIRKKQKEQTPPPPPPPPPVK
jgi:predicted  nucleic acid-binding Zn-ribbon protein